MVRVLCKFGPILGITYFFSRKTTLCRAKVKRKLPELIESRRCCIMLDGFHCPRLTSETTSKYLGIYFGIYDQQKRKTVFFLLHFGVLHKGTDKHLRERVEEVLGSWGILNYYQKKILPVVGDGPICNAFSDHFASLCASHSVSNILKRYNLCVYISI